MPTQIIIVLILTMFINGMTTLSYAVRIIGVRTGRIAITFSLFNIVVLLSRTANTLQAPLLAKTVEQHLKQGISSNVLVFRYIIASCTVGAVLGALLIPTFQRLLLKAVMHFSIYKSVPRLFYLGFSGAGMQFLKESIRMPTRQQLLDFPTRRNFPWRIFIYNVVATAIITIAVLSCVYAAYLNPAYRTTASNLSGVINGMATVLMVLFIDPHLSILTDDVVLGKLSEADFRKFISRMVMARIVGTLLAQVLFFPAAQLIAWLAEKV